MKKRSAIVLGSILAALSAAVVLVTLAMPIQEASSVGDPRQEPPLVRLAVPVPVAGTDRAFTGVIGAKVQSDLGFRVPGKIVERLVDVGQTVNAGQVLMRIDDTDLLLVFAAKRNAVSAARSVVVQRQADERRYAGLLDKRWVPRQLYDAAKAELDTARAQLAVAEAEAQVAQNETTYAVLVANSDGTVVDTLGDPGQVVSPGQPVVRVAQSGSREAVVALPETLRPVIGSVAEATVYGREGRRITARLRQLSDSADPLTRTYEARYVLDGEAADAPLGATVTIRLASESDRTEFQVPLGAVLDDGRKTGVWALDSATSTVHFRPVELLRLTSEAAVISGLDSKDPIVSLGAHLLHEGALVRAASASKGY